MKTKKIYAVLGLAPGYNAQPSVIEQVKTDDFFDAVCQLTQQLCEKYSTKDISISFVLSRSQTIYSKRFGAPEGGEPTITFESTANPFFVKTEADMGIWETRVKLALKELKKHLKQSTLSINTMEVEFEYIK